ncbi:MAG: SAM-dependent methyltransferase, partial [Myxococcota bacterium]
MTDEHATLKGRYEAQPYGGQAYRATHPDRLAAVARLVGIDAPDVATARILEIGCGDGFNLVAMADGLPDARLVGVDLSDEILAPGRRCAEAVGLDNLELVAGGLPDLPVPTGEFDYVIAHGVYSWLPPDVLETAMDQIARALAPNGLAYVSFNAYPGWHLRMLAREMMRMEVRVDDERSAAEQVGRAQALLDYVSEELGENGHHALVLKYAASQLKGRSETYLFHDYLAPFNTPMTFTEFA